MSRRTSRPARRLGTLTALTTAALLAGTVAPATAAMPATDLVGAATGTALLLTLNLPGGTATRIELALDPVTGTVSRTTSQTASADATVLRGTLGGQAFSTGTSAAKLPSPTSAQSNPTGALAEGLAGTPLANLLKVELLPSKAAVATGPSSSSEAAVANLGAGLPDALAGALAPLAGPLTAAVGQILTALATASGTPVASICAGATSAVTALDPATSAVDEALAALPVTIPVQEALDTTTLRALCGLSSTLTELNTALQDALGSLTGDSGVLGTGLVTSRQHITRSGDVVTSTASSSIAGLTLLGQTPFAKTQVLQTASTASAGGAPGSATAAVTSTIADLTGGAVDPFAQVRTTIAGIRSSFVGEGTLPSGLDTLFDDLFSTLNAALAPVGVTLFKLDDSADTKALTSCPAALTGFLSGVHMATNGDCAAAATRGVGLSVTLPAALAGPLGVGGPLVELQIVPTSAVVRAQAAGAPTVVPPPAAPPAQAPPTTLPRTGGAPPVAALAAVLLAGAAVLRRRRTA